MKITIESTAKVVTLVVDGRDIPARVWQGATESGIPVQCFITRIAPEIHETDPRFAEVTAQFSRELMSMATPRATIEAIPLRLIL